MVTFWARVIGFVGAFSTSGMTDFASFGWVFRVISTIWARFITLVVIQVVIIFTRGTFIIRWTSTGDTRTVTQFTSLGGVRWIGSIWARVDTESVV
jgi:hypothetical protein